MRSNSDSRHSAYEEDGGSRKQDGSLSIVVLDNKAALMERNAKSELCLAPRFVGYLSRQILANYLIQ